MTKKNSKVVVGCCCWPLFSGCCCWPLFSRSKLYKFASFYLQCQRSENHHKPPTVTCVCVLKRVQPKEGLLDWVWRWDGDSVSRFSVCRRGPPRRKYGVGRTEHWKKRNAPPSPTRIKSLKKGGNYNTTKREVVGRSLECVWRA